MPNNKIKSSLSSLDKKLCPLFKILGINVINMENLKLAI